MGSHVIQKDHPDIGAFIVLHDEYHAFIFHEEPFQSSVEWVEFDVKSGQIDFILSEGRLENFGIAVPDDIGRYLKNMDKISIALKDDLVVKEERIVTLVTHH